MELGVTLQSLEGVGDGDKELEEHNKDLEGLKGNNEALQRLGEEREEELGEDFEEELGVELKEEL